MLMLASFLMQQQWRLYSRPARCRRVFDKSPLQVYIFLLYIFIYMYTNLNMKERPPTRRRKAASHVKFCLLLPLLFSSFLLLLLLLCCCRWQKRISRLLSRASSIQSLLPRIIQTDSSSNRKKFTIFKNIKTATRSGNWLKSLNKLCSLSRMSLLSFYCNNNSKLIQWRVLALEPENKLLLQIVVDGFTESYYSLQFTFLQSL